MAEREGALGRWSRLKRGAESATPAVDPAESAGAPDERRPDEEEEEAVVDLATLPPAESLRADSDYTAFLRRGVPEALRRAALRRAWATDPAIAGFRGFAEYDWDCNAPGYGALRAADDLARLCDAILPPPSPEPVPAAPEPEPERPGASPASEELPDAGREVA